MPVREVQAYQVQAQNPDPDRPVAAGQDGAGQVVEAGGAGRAAVALALRLDVVPTVTGDLGATAMRAADALGPAMLPTSSKHRASSINDAGFTRAGMSGTGLTGGPLLNCSPCSSAPSA